MSIHSVSLKGRRDNNEDKDTKILNIDRRDKNMLPINFFAVYDGHGGKYVSTFLSDKLPKYFMTAKEFPFTKKYTANVFAEVQNNLKINHKNASTRCGSTCLCLIHYIENNENYINVFNVGDSRCIICRDTIAIPLTVDHKPMMPVEKRRIEKLGGNIYFDGNDYRIKDLSVSRAFGDLNVEPYVSAKPDIYKYRLEKTDRFIVLACDGLYDVMSNQDIVNFILNESYDESFYRINKNNNSVNIAKKLGELAIQMGSTDNITIIIIFLD
jgi:protein phosphatase 1L